MRSEQEMTGLILSTAAGDDRIRAVILNGSRATPSAPKDKYRDYDIIYAVTDVEPFRQGTPWLDRFGQRVMMLRPFEMDGDLDRPVCRFLVQFTDGNRLDLTIAALPALPDAVKADPVGVPLLDKDGLLAGVPFMGEEIYHVGKPTATQFENACNAFWWDLQSIAKGLMRGEIPLVMEVLDYNRHTLAKMISWHIGAQTDWSASTGKFGKYIGKHLDPALYRRYLATWPTADHAASLAAAEASCNLFRELATGLADRLGYRYPHEDDRRMTAYYHKVLRDEL